MSKRFFIEVPYFEKEYAIEKTANNPPGPSRSSASDCNAHANK